MTLIACRGLAASGKSHWSREQQAQDSSIVVVSKDDLRLALHGGVWSRRNEGQIVTIETAVIKDTLKSKRTCIVDSTNLNPMHMARFQALAKEYQVHFHVQDFTDVPLETCIANDLKRLHSVGERVIRKMWSDYILPEQTGKATWLQDGLPLVVLVDIDGTMALKGDRSPYDESEKLLGDQVNESLATLLNFLDINLDVVFVSGRSEAARGWTEQWLKNNGIHYHELLMRAAGDKRSDIIVKREIFENSIAGNYSVVGVFDDRLSVIQECWVPLGLQVFNCNQNLVWF